jgi:uncharacterized damage-inducible protein DinB
MTDETITTLFRHNLWANARLFEVCARLSAEQLNAQIVGTYGSIRDTLQHTVNAERSYLHRLRTGQPYRPPADAPPLTLSELQESIRLSGEGLVAIASTITAQDRVTVKWDDGTSRSLPCAILLTQAINHATEHRAQIMATLTHIGLEPPELDGWSYFDAHEESLNQ